jgi:PAS domain S-box-containing protein
MAPTSYSFIDVAVLAPVRERFARGEALAILDARLETVIWANGPGALLLGFADIDAALDAPAGLAMLARRQISAVPGFPDAASERPAAVRMGDGAHNLIVNSVTLPDGAAAVLIAEPASSSDEGLQAKRAVSGLSPQDGFFAAMVGADGTVHAASDGFEALGFEAATLEALANEVRREADRLVKRMVPAGGRKIPAALARLSDAPALHLMIAVDDGADERLADQPAEEPEEEAAPPTEPSAEHASVGEDIETAADTALPETAQDAALPSDDADRQVADASAPVTASPIRFVWRTDAAGRFTALSDEFLEAVGLSPDEVIGRPFRDVAGELSIDPDGEIAALLERRDTWSGRSVAWPIAKSRHIVPVDLAALPVYSRDRSFEGFRGFGVARMGDATLRPPPAAERPQQVDAARPEAESAAARSERPTLHVIARREESGGDKVVSLHGRRTVEPVEQLSQGERNAFEEIGARLRKDYEQPEPVVRDAETASSTPTEKSVDQPEARANSTTASKDADQTTVDEAGAGDSGSQDESQADLQIIAEETGAAVAPPFPVVEADAAGTQEGRDGPAHLASESDRGDDHGKAPIYSPDADLVGDGIAPAPAKMAERATDDDHEDSAAADGTSSGRDRDRDMAAPAEAVAIAEPVLPIRLRPAPPIRSVGFMPAAFSVLTHTIPAEIDRGLLTGLPLPVLIHSGDELHFANKAWFEMTGYGSLAAIEAAGGIEKLFAGREATVTAGADDRLILCRADGSQTAVLVHLQAVNWNGARALMLSAREPVTDATAEDAAQLAEVQSRLDEMRTIMDTATDGVVLIADDGTIRSISHPAEALFGMDSAELEGKPFTSLFALESQRAARDYLAGLSDNGVASVLNDGREVIGREAAGRFIPLFMTIGRLPDERGYCAVLRDITQWKRAEEELTQARSQAERASSQKTDFLARVSHEIRTPLNAIIGFSELMMDEKFGQIGSDRFRDYLRDINKSGNHVLDLVNDLLDISKIEAGELELSYEAVSLNETLAETVAMMQPQANRERVIIRSSMATRLPDVVADQRSLRQIALNLLSNALRYTPAGGQVVVSTAYEPSGDVVLRIRDTGIGMSLSEIEQALKPFKQINALKRGRGDGTGLGLPLTKAMVEANRARFQINSAPGEGTLVEVTFPSTRVLAE